MSKLNEKILKRNMKTKKLTIKGITPLFTKIITTADKYTEADSVDKHGFIDPKKVQAIKDIQTVVEIGTSVRFVKPGDKISLNFARYGVRKYNKDSSKADMNDHYNEVLEYQIPMISLNQKEHLFIDEGDVEFIIKDYKEEEIEVNVAGLSLTPQKSNLILS